MALQLAQADQTNAHAAAAAAVAHATACQAAVVQATAALPAPPPAPVMAPLYVRRPYVPSAEPRIPEDWKMKPAGEATKYKNLTTSQARVRWINDFSAAMKADREEQIAGIAAFVKTYKMIDDGCKVRVQTVEDWEETFADMNFIDFLRKLSHAVNPTDNVGDFTAQNENISGSVLE
jgi:hypothetical protein